MSSIFGSKPQPPMVDPNIAAMRAREERRAEDDRTRQTQLGLAQETARRRGLGLRSLLGPLGLGDLTTKLGAG